MPDESDDGILADACDADTPDDVVDSAIDDCASSDKSAWDIAQAKTAAGVASAEAAEVATNPDERVQLIGDSNDYDKQADAIMKDAAQIDGAAATARGDLGWLQGHVDVVYDGIYDQYIKRSPEDIARMIDLYSRQNRSLPSRQVIMKALLDAYYRRPANPPQYPLPIHERTMPAMEDAAAGDNRRQMLNFYVQTRKYAAALQWQQLNNQFYATAVDLQNNAPTLVSRLRMKAYSHEVIARYRKAAAH